MNKNDAIKGRLNLAEMMIRSIYNEGGFKLLSSAMNNAFYHGDIIIQHENIICPEFGSNDDLQLTLDQIFDAISIINDLGAKQ